MSKKYSLGLFLAVLIMAQLACNAANPAGAPDTVATLNALYTAAAQTSAPVVVPVGSTATPSPIIPTASPIQPFPTSTPFVLPTSTSGPVVRCDAADFVKDVSVSDGTVIGRGADFTKTWRLKNVGTCTWTTGYALVFVSGDLMSGPTVSSLRTNVNPGQTIDISATLTAPSKDGHYRGYWKLRNAANAVFGVGSQGETAFWVDINVKGPAYVAYDFAAKFCDADWENNNSILPCPGTQDDDRGYVIQLASPKMENGIKSGDPGLLTFPKSSSNGFIQGTYPAITIRNGDRFHALINCRYNADRCDVTFRLQFKSGGKTTTLGAWREVYEGQYSSIDLDLSWLAGQKGKFILIVETNGSPKDDEALWVAPRIIRYGTPSPTKTPTPTRTPTATPTV